MNSPFEKVNDLYEQEPYNIEVTKKEKKVSELIEDLGEDEKEEFYDNLKELGGRIEKPTKEIENYSFWGKKIPDKFMGGWKNYVWAALAIGGGATAVVDIIENPGELGTLFDLGYGAGVCGSCLSLLGIIRDKLYGESILSEELTNLPYSDFRNISEEYGFL